MKKNKILLLGDYSGNNAGHNALLCGILHELSSLSVEIVLPSINPKKLRRNAHLKMDNVKIIGVGPQHLGVKFLSLRLFKEMLSARAVLLTDNLFYDSGLFNPYKNNLLTLNILVNVAAKNRIPLVYYNSGVGPISTLIGQKLVQRIREHLSIITLRDLEAFSSDVWIDHRQKAMVTSDSGFNFPVEEICKKNSNSLISLLKISSEKTWIGVNFSYHFARIWAIENSRKTMNTVVDWNKELAKLLANIQDKFDCEILLFVTHPNDMRFSRKVASLMDNARPVLVVDGTRWNIQELSAVVAQCKTIIGTRYHELVWFAALGTPIVGINCGDKMEGLFDSLRTREFLLEVGDLRLDSVSSLLCKILDSAVNNATAIKLRINELRSLAKSTSLMLQDIC